MRLVTWNCNGALRRKYAQLDLLDADILVIQECEDPAQSTAEYRSWAGEHVWVGDGKNKGIGVFARRGQGIQRLAWPDNGLQLFLPVRIGGAVDILAVWTQQTTPAKFAYIGQFWHYLRAHKASLGPSTIIAGDLNSNQIWDKPRRTWNHSDCVRDLRELGFRSLYHEVNGEEQGQERQPTFYLHRSEAKPYHLDYVFAHEKELASGNPLVSVGRPALWLASSDHMPILVDWTHTSAFG